MITALRTGFAYAAIAAAGGLALSTAVLPGTATAATSQPAAATSDVEIRSGAGTQYKIIGGLEKGQRIRALAKSASGWVRVRFDKSPAYISAAHLKVGNDLPSTPASIATQGVKITTALLNVRTGPSSTRAVVGQLAEAAHITLTGTLSHGFAQLMYQKHYRWVSITYLASSAPPTPATSPSEAGLQALAFARKQLGKPYTYGATGPTAYDCSGLTLKSWAAAGVSLPRTSQLQFSAGTKIAKSELQPGDLVFFYGPTPSHVGIYSGNGEIIHAPRPGKVVEYIKLSYMPYAGARRPG
jgi:cell wall-associated NlpC family hydrolase